MAKNPCLSCGACCACFRCSFYWGELDATDSFGVPEALTVKISPFRVAMKTLEREGKRCIALMGTIGTAVRCAIYDRRSSVCRDFSPSFMKGEQNPRCDRARAAFGLLPLTPEDWREPPLFKSA